MERAHVQRGDEIRQGHLQVQAPLHLQEWGRGVPVKNPLSFVTKEAKFNLSSGCISNGRIISFVDFPHSNAIEGETLLKEG